MIGPEVICITNHPHHQDIHIHNTTRGHKIKWDHQCHRVHLDSQHRAYDTHRKIKWCIFQLIIALHVEDLPLLRNLDRQRQCSKEHDNLGPECPSFNRPSQLHHLPNKMWNPWNGHGLQYYWTARIKWNLMKWRKWKWILWYLIKMTMPTVK